MNKISPMSAGILYEALTSRKLIFAERLKQTLKSKNIKQTQLADFLEINNQLITNYVKGKNYPRPETLNKICNFLQVEKDWLLGIDVIPDPKDIINSLDFTTLDRSINKILDIIKCELDENWQYIDESYFKNIESILRNLFRLSYRGTSKVKTYIHDIKINHHYQALDVFDYMLPASRETIDTTIEAFKKR